MQTVARPTVSPCCASASTPVVDTGRVAVARCSRCGNYSGYHHPDPSASHDPWGGNSVTTEFLDTLKFRRQIQAEQIHREFRELFADGPVLDYGCGQGAFLAFLRAKGVDAKGCDLSVISSQSGTAVAGAFVQLDRPWGMPPGGSPRTVTMLDVLEHCDQPQALIRGLMNAGATRFLIKIPVAGGPAFLIARIMARFGKTDLMDKLFLAGEAAPHLLYFTDRGVQQLFADCGLQLTGRLSLAEIGSELPARIRGGALMRNPVVRLSLSLMGRVAEQMGRLWSDTAVFRFEKR